MTSDPDDPGPRFLVREPDDGGGVVPPPPVVTGVDVGVGMYVPPPPPAETTLSRSSWDWASRNPDLFSWWASWKRMRACWVKVPKYEVMVVVALKKPRFFKTVWRSFTSVPVSP